MSLLVVLSALIVAGILAGGAWAWWIAGRTLPRPRHLSRYGLDAQAALWRHPASRSRDWQADNPLPPGWAEAASPVRPAGPDDDPDFISALERQIRDRRHGEES